ncbi:hypothetical protein AAFC00_007293 [Neodothiora populina]|uniref:Major facilitator superfamily (MFS) profile domain-containing protein n=1 Tax=Neodothiora populina TaxID=2781224 RepID=A0ABR3PHT3_9PEZI
MAAPHQQHATAFPDDSEAANARRLNHDQQQADVDDLPGTIRIFSEYDVDENGNKSLILNPTPTDSPNDPLNWSLVRKTWSASLVLFITALTAATSNSAGAAGTVLVDDYGIGWGVQNTAAGVLFIGIGYCTLLLSSAPWLYGRRISYLICLCFSIVGAAWFASTQNKTDTILCQLFVGASESVAEATVQLSLMDLFFQHQRGSVLGIYVLATSVGTFLGPLISGYIADSALGWRWMGWFAVIISGVTLLVFALGLEETAFERDIYLGISTSHQGSREEIGASNTAPKVIHPTDKGAEHLGSVAGSEKTFDHATLAPTAAESQSTHNPKHTNNMVSNGTDMTKKSYLKRVALITPSPSLRGLGVKQYIMRTIHTVRLFWFPALIYSGLQWGAQDAWLSFYLTVEDDNWTSAPYNYGDAADAIMLVPTLIGSVIGCVYGGWFSDVFVRWCARRNGGVSEAEHRLWLMFPPGILSPIGLFLFGIGTDRVWAWGAPYVGLGFIGFGWGCAGDLSMAYLMDAYPDAVLEGMVGVSVINNSLACIFTFVCSIWLDDHSVTQVFVTLGILSFVFMVLFTIPMMWFGKDCRRWTRDAYRAYLIRRADQ